MGRTCNTILRYPATIKNKNYPQEFEAIIIYTYLFNIDVGAADDHCQKVDKNETHCRPQVTLLLRFWVFFSIDCVLRLCCFLLFKSSLDVLQTQYGKVEKMEAGTCLQKILGMKW